MFPRSPLPLFLPLLHNREAVADLPQGMQLANHPTHQLGREEVEEGRRERGEEGEERGEGGEGRGRRGGGRRGKVGKLLRFAMHNFPPAYVPHCA